MTVASALGFLLYSMRSTAEEMIQFFKKVFQFAENLHRISVQFPIYIHSSLCTCHLSTAYEIHHYNG